MDTQNKSNPGLERSILRELIPDSFIKGVKFAENELVVRVYTPGAAPFNGIKKIREIYSMYHFELYDESELEWFQKSSCEVCDSKESSS